MDTGKSFSYVFDDPNWIVKVLVAGIIGIFSILIIPAFILLGYMAQIARNVIAGQERPLPEWTNFGDMLVDGFKLFIVYLIYFVPYIVLIFLSSIRNVGPLFACLALLYVLAVAIALPAAFGRYIERGEIGDALRFQAVLADVQANLSDFLIVWLLGIVASIIASLGIIACGIGLIFTLPYAYMVQAHLWGQLYLKIRGATAPAADAEATPL